MDCTSKILPALFHDSSISQKISCCHTRTEAIVNGVISIHAIDTVIKDIQNIPFISLGTDSSNHGNKELFPFVLQSFDFNKGGTQVRLLDLRGTFDEKAQTIAGVIQQLLAKYNLKDKIVAFFGDNTNTNFGSKNRGGKKKIFALLKENVNPKLVGIGCFVWYWPV